MPIRFLDEAPAKGGRIRFLDEPVSAQRVEPGEKNAPLLPSGPAFTAVETARNIKDQVIDDTARGIGYLMPREKLAVRDTPLSLAQGAANATTTAGTIGQVALHSRSTPVGQFVEKGLGTLNPLIPKFADVGEDVAGYTRKLGKEAEDYWRSQMSKEGKEPTELVNKVFTSSVQSVPGMGVMAGMSAPLVAAARGVPALTKLGWLGKFFVNSPEALAAGTGEGVFSAGQNAAQTGDKVRETDIAHLQELPEFKIAFEATPKTLPNEARAELAREAMARKAEDQVFLTTAPWTAASGAATGGTIANILKKGFVKGAKGIVKELFKNIIEEAGQETIQSGGEQALQNLAEKRFIDPSTDPLSGVGEASLVGGLSGGLLGTVGGGVSAGVKRIATGARAKRIQDIRSDRNARNSEFLADAQRGSLMDPALNDQAYAPLAQPFGQPFTAPDGSQNVKLSSTMSKEAPAPVSVQAPAQEQTPLAAPSVATPAPIPSLPPSDVPLSDEEYAAERQKEADLAHPPKEKPGRITPDQAVNVKTLIDAGVTPQQAVQAISPAPSLVAGQADSPAPSTERVAQPNQTRKGKVKFLSATSSGTPAQGDQNAPGTGRETPPPVGQEPAAAVQEARPKLDDQAGQGPAPVAEVGQGSAPGPSVAEAVAQGLPVRLPPGTLRVRATFADGRSATVNAGDIKAFAGVGKITKVEPLRKDTKGKDIPALGKIQVKAAKTQKLAPAPEPVSAARPVPDALGTAKSPLAEPITAPEASSTPPEAKPPESLTAKELLKQYDDGEMSGHDIYEALEAKADKTSQESNAIAEYERGYAEYVGNGMRMENLGDEYLLKALRKQPKKENATTGPQELQPPERFKSMPGYHVGVINIAKNSKKPLNAAAVDAYKIKLPEGYTRSGDRYVYTAPEASAGKPDTLKSEPEPTGTPGGRAGQGELTPTVFADFALKSREREASEYRRKAVKERGYSREEMAQRYDAMADDLLSVDAEEFKKDVRENPDYYLKSNIDPFLRFKNRITNRGEQSLSRQSGAESKQGADNGKENAGTAEGTGTGTGAGAAQGTDVGSTPGERGGVPPVATEAGNAVGEASSQGRGEGAGRPPQSVASTLASPDAPTPPLAATRDPQGAGEASTETGSQRLKRIAAEKKAPAAAKPEPVKVTASWDASTEFLKRALREPVTAKEAQDAYAAFKASKDATIAEIRAKLDIDPRFARKRKATKDDIAAKSFKSRLERFARLATDGITWQPFTEKYEQAVDRMVSELTDESIKAHFDKQAKESAETKKALENPETLHEFGTFVAHKGDEALSPEQRIKYDTLRAEAGMTHRENAKIAERAVVGKVEGASDTPMAIVERMHSKRGSNVFIVTMGSRVDGDTFKELARKARALGGNWSREWKPTDSPAGFMFNEKAKAEQFMGLRTHAVDQTEKVVAEKEETREAAAERLTQMADKMESDGNDSLNQDRLSNTAKRARQADSAEADASAKISIAKTLRNIAIAVRDGRAKFLKNLRTRTQVEELARLAREGKRNRIEQLRKTLEASHVENHWQEYKTGTYTTDNEARRAATRDAGNAVRTELRKREEQPISQDDVAAAKFPDYQIYREQIEAAAKTATQGDYRGQHKSPKLGIQINALLRRNVGQYITVPENLANDIATKLPGAAWSLDTEVASAKRLRSMNITNDAELRSAIREYLEFKEDGPGVDKAKKLRREIVGQNVGIDYFPTPPALASEVVRKADIRSGHSVLEPEAGDGQLANQVRAQHPEAAIAVIEQSSTLRKILEAEGHNIVGQDFMEYTGPQVDRIVMNPPFGGNADIQHVRHAYDMLKPGGRLVAIMSEHAFFGSEKEAADFRDWLDELGGTSERNPENSFMDKTIAGPTTGVNTRTVVIDKPAEVQAEREAVEESDQPAGVPSKITPEIVEAQRKLNNAEELYRRRYGDEAFAILAKPANDLNNELWIELVNKVLSADPIGDKPTTPPLDAQEADELVTRLEDDVANQAANKDGRNDIFQFTDKAARVSEQAAIQFITDHLPPGMSSALDRFESDAVIPLAHLPQEATDDLPVYAITTDVSGKIRIVAEKSEKLPGGDWQNWFVELDQDQIEDLKWDSPEAKLMADGRSDEVTTEREEADIGSTPDQVAKPEPVKAASVEDAEKAYRAATAETERLRTNLTMLMQESKDYAQEHDLLTTRRGHRGYYSTSAGDFKASAKKLNKDVYTSIKRRESEAEAKLLNHQEEVEKPARKALDASNYSKMANDQAAPEISRLAARVGMNPEDSEADAKLLDQAKVMARELHPGATEEEIATIAPFIGGMARVEAVDGKTVTVVKLKQMLPFENRLQLNAARFTRINNALSQNGMYTDRVYNKGLLINQTKEPWTAKLSETFIEKASIILNSNEVSAEDAEDFIASMPKAVEAAKAKLVEDTVREAEEAKAAAAEQARIEALPVEEAPSGTKWSPVKLSKKPGSADSVLKSAAKGKTLPVLAMMLVKDKTGHTTDLDNYVSMPMDKPDGMYHWVKDIGWTKNDEPVEDFPVTPELKGKGKPLTLSGLLVDSFKKGILAVRDAMSTDENRYVLNSIAVEVKDGVARMIATDGRRLHVATVGKIKAPDSTTLLHRGTVDLIVKSNGTGPITITRNDERAEISDGNADINARLMDGQFPNYNQVIPSEDGQTVRVEVNRKVLGQALDDVMPYLTADPNLTHDSLSLTSIRMTIGPKEITLTANKGSKQYHRKKVVPVSKALKSGDTIETAVSAGYLAQLLKQSDSDTVVIGAESDLSPLTTSTPDGSAFGVVMPMRVSARSDIFADQPRGITRPAFTTALATETRGLNFASDNVTASSYDDAPVWFKDAVERGGGQAARKLDRGGTVDVEEVQYGKDDVTSVPTVIAARTVSAKVSRFLASANRESYLALSESGAEGPGQYAAEGDIRSAVDRFRRATRTPRITKEALGLDPEKKVTSWATWQTLKSSKMNRIAGMTGGEGVVFRSKNGRFAYKLYPVSRGIGATLRLGDTDSEGKTNAKAVLGTYENLLEKISVMSSMGGTPTEILGITDEGIVVTKQPWGGKEFADESVDKELVRMGAVNASAFFTGPVDAEYYVSVDDGVPYLVSDIRNANFVQDNNGLARLIDPIITRIPDGVIGGKPELKALVSEAGKFENTNRSDISFYRNSSGQVRAVTLGNRSHFFLDRYDNASQLRGDIREEAGHRLINELGGPAWRTIGMQTYGGKWGEIVSEIKRNYGFESGTSEFNHELVAKALRDGKNKVGLLRRFMDSVVTAFKRLARRLGLNLSMSDAEVRNFLNGLLKQKEGQYGNRRENIFRGEGRKGQKNPLERGKDAQRRIADYRSRVRKEEGPSLHARRIGRCEYVPGVARTPAFESAAGAFSAYGVDAIPVKNLNESFVDDDIALISADGGESAAIASAIHELTHVAYKNESSIAVRQVESVDVDSMAFNEFLGEYQRKAPRVLRDILNEACSIAGVEWSNNLPPKTKAKVLSEMKRILSEEAVAYWNSGRNEYAGLFKDKDAAIQDRQEFLDSEGVASQKPQFAKGPRVPKNAAATPDDYEALRRKYNAKQRVMEAVRAQIRATTTERKELRRDLMDYIKAELAPEDHGKAIASVTKALMMLRVADMRRAALAAMDEIDAMEKGRFEKALLAAEIYGKAQGRKEGLREGAKAGREQEAAEVRQAAAAKLESLTGQPAKAKTPQGQVAEAVRAGKKLQSEREIYSEDGFLSKARDFMAEEKAKRDGRDYAKLTPEEKDQYREPLTMIVDRVAARLDMGKEAIDALPEDATEKRQAIARDILNQTFGGRRTERFSKVYGDSLTALTTMHTDLVQGLHKKWMRAAKVVLKMFHNNDATRSSSRRYKALTDEAKIEMKKLLDGKTPEGLEGMRYDEIRSLVQNALAINKVSMMDVKRLVMFRNHSAREYGKLLAAEVRSVLPSLVDKAKGVPRGRSLMRALFIDHFADAKTMLSAPFTNDTANHLYSVLKGVDDGINRFTKRYVGEMLAVMKEQGITTMKMAEMESRRQKIDLGNGQSLEISDAERLNIAAGLRDPEWRYAFCTSPTELEAFRGSDTTQSHDAGVFVPLDYEAGVAAAVAIEATITPEERRIVDQLVRLATGMAPEINQVSRQLLGRSIATKDVYWPIERDVQGKEIPDLDLDSTATWTENSGFTNDRVRNKNPMVIRSVFQKYMDHAEETGAYVNATMPFLNIRNSIVADHGALKTALNERMGSKYISSLLEMMQGIAGKSKSTVRSEAVKAINKVASNVAKSALFLNVNSWFANKTGNFLFWSELKEIDSKLAARFAMRTARPVLRSTEKYKQMYDEMIEAAPYLWARWEENYVRTMMPTTIDERAGRKHPRWSYANKRLDEIGLSMMRDAEITNALNLYETLTASGYSKAKAASTVAELTRRTQNATSDLEMGTFLRQMKRSGAGWMFPFISQTVVAHNLMVNHMQQGRHAAAGRTAVMIVASLAVMSMWRELLKEMLSGQFPPSDEKKAQMAMNVFTGAMEQALPYMAAFSQVFDMLRTGKTYNAGIGTGLLERPTLDVMRGAMKIANGKDGPQDWVSFVNGMLSLFGRGSGGIANILNSIIVTPREEKTYLRETGRTAPKRAGFEGFKGFEGF